MISSIKDPEGKIIAYCEYRLVGQSGYETPNGDHIWVNDVWIHHEYRFKGNMNRIIDNIMVSFPQANYGYFQRKDVNMKLHIYSRRQWERRRKVYEVK